MQMMDDDIPRPAFTVPPILAPTDSWTATSEASVDLQNTPSINSEDDFNSCADDEECISPRNYITPSPLPFVLQLPPLRRKSSRAPSVEPPSTEPPSAEQQTPIEPPLKQTYSVRSCSEDEIPAFEDLANRTVGTFGFLAGLVVYFGFCCCTFGRRTSDEIAETYSKHTLFSYVWPIESP